MVVLIGVVCLIVGIVLLGMNKVSSDVVFCGSFLLVDIFYVDKNDIFIDLMIS